MKDERNIPGNADVPVGMGGKGANEDVGAPREWYSRGYLPHRDKAHLIQSVTFRLADSLPQTALNQLEEELADTPAHRLETERRMKIEAWLDSGRGCCALRHSKVAAYVEESLKHFHSERYHLHAWCIMPNHVHVLVEPVADLASIIQGWKSFTARWILERNEHLDLQIPNSKHLWMREYWDRFIRDERHYKSAVDYIHMNPVNAGLCHMPEDWEWSSAHPGNAAFLVGINSNSRNADEDVGAPRR